jgi:hypothetical protein
MSPNWNDDIKDLFTQLEAGCMLTVDFFDPRLDLASYESVKLYSASILGAVGNGTMPKGGPQWPQQRVDIFKKWTEIGCPEN